MAIAFDNKASGSVTNSAISWAHTINSNTNGILLVDIGQLGTGTITSIKYAGTAMTRVTSGVISSSPEMELWYLLNPPSGLGTVNGTFSNVAQITGISSSYTGVDQTTPIAGSVAGSANGASSGSVTRTIAANNWWHGGIIMTTRPGTTTIGNERGTQANGTSQESMIADATSGTVQWTFPISRQVQIGAELAAAAAVGATPAFVSKIMLMGVGN